jgi:SAM-dependent methyltransferase
VSSRRTDRGLLGALPLTVRNLGRSVLLRQRMAWWGNLRRQAPFSDTYGHDRGTPVDRTYLDQYFARQRGDVRGRVLEVKDRRYTTRFGHGRVTSSDIVDIDPDNEKATIVADLAREGSLPSAAFDCIIVTQTLQHVPHVAAAMKNLWSALAPGGVLLLTVPTIQRSDPPRQRDLYRWTAAGLEVLVSDACPDAQVDVVSYGNLTAAIAFLLGLGSQELRATDLDANDPDHGVIACARVQLPGTA